MAKYLILGAGRLGGTLGRRLADLGHDVVFHVPDPDAAKYADARDHTRVTLAKAGSAPPDNCAMTFIATPMDATQGAVAGLGDMAGKVVVDCTNPVTFGNAGMALAIDANTSATRMIAEWLPGAHVLKSFNQVGSDVLANTASLTPTPIMGVAGDDASAKTALMALAGNLGFDPIDAGGLENARLLEAFALLWMGQAFASGNPAGFAFGRAEKPR